MEKCTARTHKTKHFGTPEIIKTNANGKRTIVCRGLRLIPTHVPYFTSGITTAAKPKPAKVQMTR